MEYDGCQFFSPEKDFPIWGFFLLPKIYFNVDFFWPQTLPIRKMWWVGDTTSFGTQAFAFFWWLDTNLKTISEIKISNEQN
jgi:hypothetical protein